MRKTLIFFTFICTTLFCTFTMASAEKAQSNCSVIEQRVDTLETQIKILEANLPKRIRKLPLELPNLTSNGAIQETMTRLYDMFNINFVEYKQQINNNRQFCSKEGFEQYINILTNSQWLNDVVQKKMLLYIRPNQGPKILKEGAQDNRYGWLIEIPFTVTLENINEKIEHPIVATLLVQRASELAHPLGILVTSIQLKASN